MKIMTRASAIFGGVCLALLTVAPVRAHHSFSTEYGARNIKRFIRNTLTIKIADKILEEGSNNLYKVIFEDSKLICVQTSA